MSVNFQTQPSLRQAQLTPWGQNTFTERSSVPALNSKALLFSVNVPQTQIHVSAQALHGQQVKWPSKICSIGSWRRKAKAPSCHGTSTRWIVWVSCTHFRKDIVIVWGPYGATVTHGGKWILEDILELGFRDTTSPIRNPAMKEKIIIFS